MNILNNFDIRMPTHANPRGAATMWVVWGEHVKKHVLWFLIRY